MSEDPSSAWSRVLSWQSFLLLIAIANLLWHQAPVITRRPADADFVDPLQQSRVRARLWQDPVAAVADYARSTNALSGVSGAVTTSGATRVLLVTVSGRPYASSAESRMRQRVALHHALNAADYASTAQDRLNAMSFTNLQGETIPLAVELFRPLYQKGEAQYDQVAVMWLPDEEFHRSPFTRVQRLVDELCSVSTDSVSVALIGPRTSSMLKEMVDEVEHWPSASRPVFDVYSPIATLAPLRAGLTNGYSYSRYFAEKGVNFHELVATDDQLLRKVLDELATRRINPHEQAIYLFAEHDSEYGRALPRTFCDVLQRTQMKEVALSTSGFASRVVAARWMLRKWMNPRLGDSLWSTRSVVDAPVITERLDKVTTFSFLAGLDGALPAGQADELAAKNAERSMHTPPLEKAEGRAQADYIIRVAQAHAGVPVRAIGVLGGDVYDKLILLQALRRTWPEAVYFTTDLDARYLAIENREWARNLIVAASYELQPPMERNLVSPTPPVFRDSHQSALFAACLSALRDSEVSAPSPRLFEVGLRGFQELKNAVPSGTAANRGIDPGDLRAWLKRTLDFKWTRMPPQPGSHGKSEKPHTQNVALALCTALAVLSACSIRWTGSGGRQMAWAAISIAGMVGAVCLLPFGSGGYRLGILFILLALLLSRGAAGVCLALIAGGAVVAWLFFASLRHLVEQIHESVPRELPLEPLAWGEGVSIWPTVFIRLALSSVCVLTILWMLRQAMGQRGLLVRSREWSKLSPRKLLRFGRHLWWCWGVKLWRNPYAWCVDRSSALPLSWRMAKPQEADAAPVDRLRAIWHHYNSHGAPVWRLARAAVLAFFYLLLLDSLFALAHDWTGDVAPFPVARGPAAALAHEYSLWLYLLLFFLLLALVVDSHKLLADGIHKAIGVVGGVRHVDLRHLGARMGADSGSAAVFIHGEVELYLALLRRVSTGSGRWISIVYIPFLILLATWFSRSKYFDNWSWPWPLVVSMLLSTVVMVASSLLLSARAHDLRRRLLRRLQHLKEQAEKIGVSAAALARIAEVQREMAGLSEGVFAPWIRQPIVGGLLIPFGSVGSFELIRKLIALVNSSPGL